MCKPASMILTKDDVLWLPGSNSHENIIKHYKLNDNTRRPGFVRIEINPPMVDDRPDYNAPLERWKYRTDQDYIPDWYVESVDEERARRVLINWHSSHIVGQVTDADYITQKAGYGSTQTAGSGSTQKAGDDSTQKARNYSTQKAGYGSTQKAGYDSTQKAGYGSTQRAENSSTQTAGVGSTQTAGDDSTQKAGDDSTQTAGDYSTQKAGSCSTQKAGNGSTQTAGNYSTQTAGYGSTQKAGHDSTQTAGDDSTQTAGVGSFQVGRWFENGEYKTACRIVGEAEADRSYLFKSGAWVEV